MSIENIENKSFINYANNNTNNIGNKSDFKGMFKSINKEIQSIIGDYANKDKTEIEIKGVKYAKDQPGTAVIINDYLSDLQNRVNLSMEMLSKKGAFEDQVSKIIG